MSNYDNLPPELQAQLRREPEYTMEQRLLELFEDGKQRTINDVLIDYWRAHKRVVPRNSVTSAIARRVKTNDGIRRAGRGVYVKAGDES